MLAARVVVTQTLNGSSVAARLEDRGIRTFIPTYTREVTHARRTVVKTYPMFSRYLFAWLHDDQMAEALHIRGCVDVLRRAGSNRMAIVPDYVLASLGEPTPEEFNLEDSVTIIRGQWKDLTGKYVRTENARVVLLFQLLGRDVEMDFAARDVTRNPTR